MLLFFFSCKRIVFIVATHDFFWFTVNRIFPRILRLCCFCWVQLNCFIIATAVVGVRDFFSFKVNRFVPGHVRLCCFYCVQMNCFIIATAIVSAREKGCSFKVNPFFPGFCAFVFFCGANELFHNNDGNRRRARFFRLR